MKRKIKLTTIQTDYNGKSIFERVADELLINETFSELDESGKIESILYAEIKESERDCTVTYEEMSEGMDGVNTEMKFKKDAPQEISISRTGALEAFMYFEEGKRHICVYNTGIMPFEICIYSKRVDNRLLSDGVLEIEYIIEIKGACAQKTVFKMEIEK